MDAPQILDAKGQPLEPGDPVGGGGIYDGILLGFIEPDESHWGVAVEWPDHPCDPEVFWAPEAWQDGPLRCDEIERAP